MTTSWSNGSVTLRLDAAAVAAASYPLIVDPLLRHALVDDSRFELVLQIVKAAMTLPQLARHDPRHERLLEDIDRLSREARLVARAA